MDYLLALFGQSKTPSSSKGEEPPSLIKGEESSWVVIEINNDGALFITTTCIAENNNPDTTEMWDGTEPVCYMKDENGKMVNKFAPYSKP